jgi:hypothetical protein
MRSSTSNSRPAALTYAKVLVGICATLVFALEVLSAYLLKRYSETFARISQQYAEAVHVRPARPGEPTSVLMVGNSLLMEGIEVNRLQELTSSKMRISPIFLEATGYYDWLYGLQRLFRQGARPQVVVLGVGVESFLASGVRTDYAPMMFFDAQDILGVASDLNLEHTATSNLLLAHASVFWDVRSVIRTQILRRIVPRSRELFSLIKPKTALPPDPELEAIAISRLQRLRDLCEAHGAKLIFLIPPTPSSENAVRLLTIASHQVEVDALVPIDPATLSEAFYQSDAIHLNSEGAALFTSALATYLPKQLEGSKLLPRQIKTHPNPTS